MSTAAILWTYDDRDVLEYTLRHLLYECDEVIVLHRQGVEEAEEIVRALAEEHENLRWSYDDGRHGFQQAKVMTDLAQQARKVGHSWVVPVDPDEVWYANGSRLADFLAGVSRDVGIVTADLFNHVVTAQDDPGKPHPFQRIGWRQTHPLPLPKVAARTDKSLVIEGGNHGAKLRGAPLTAGPMLVVRHFPYRTEDQFIDKVRSNYAKLKNERRLPRSYGAHIRHYGEHLEAEGGEEVMREHFRTWFVSDEPEADDELIYDPTPLSP